MDNSDQLAVEAVDLFLALIGAEAGHMGLRSLASGGIYICGGIMPKVCCFLSLVLSRQDLTLVNMMLTAYLWLHHAKSVRAPCVLAWLSWCVCCSFGNAVR